MTLTQYTGRVARHLKRLAGVRKAPRTFCKDVEARYNCNYDPIVASIDLAEEYGWVDGRVEERCEL